MKEDIAITLGELGINETFRFGEQGELLMKLIHFDESFSFYTYATGGDPIKGSNGTKIYRAKNPASENASGFSWVKGKQRKRGKGPTMKTLFD